MAHNPVRVRIPPSPTGKIHVGNVRTALFNELFARKHAGVCILRIEDTDKARSKKEFEEDIFEGLRWLGITWDEGPDIGGPAKTYRQSERTILYTDALRQLLDNDKAYYCVCSKENPAVEGQPRPACQCAHKQEAIATKYPPEERAIRLRVPQSAITFHDHIRGDVTTDPKSFGGDFVIARSINDPLYHLAVVVDDATMNISHIIRGEDHISNTPKHIVLQQALGYPTPEYAHVPLLLDEKRRKLSKRAGEVSLTEYRKQGYLPQTMINYLALLGWNPKTDQEFFSHEELVTAFSLEGVQKSGAIFSIPKLQSMNRHYISRLTPDELYEWAKPCFTTIENKERFMAALRTEQSRISSYADDLPAKIDWYRSSWSPTDSDGGLPHYMKIITRKGKYSGAVIQENLIKISQCLESLDSSAFTATSLETTIITWIDEQQLSRAELLWPMRVALTGREHSPGPFEVSQVLGKDNTIGRLQQAATIVGEYE